MGMGMIWRLSPGVGDTVLEGTCPESLSVPEGTPSEDVICLHTIVGWAEERGLPPELVRRLPDLTRRDPLVTRKIADEIAELGYPWTANEIRAYWASRSPC